MPDDVYIPEPGDDKILGLPKTVVVVGALGLGAILLLQALNKQSGSNMVPMSTAVQLGDVQQRELEIANSLTALSGQVGAGFSGVGGQMSTFNKDMNTALRDLAIKLYNAQTDITKGFADNTNMLGALQSKQNEIDAAIRSGDQTLADRLAAQQQEMLSQFAQSNQYTLDRSIDVSNYLESAIRRGNIDVANYLESAYGRGTDSILQAFNAQTNSIMRNIDSKQKEIDAAIRSGDQMLADQLAGQQNEMLAQFRQTNRYTLDRSIDVANYLESAYGRGTDVLLQALNSQSTMAEQYYGNIMRNVETWGERGIDTSTEVGRKLSSRHDAEMAILQNIKSDQLGLTDIIERMNGSSNPDWLQWYAGWRENYGKTGKSLYDLTGDYFVDVRDYGAGRQLYGIR